MTRGLTKSKFSKVIACLVIAVMVFGLVPARYAYAAQDASGVDQEWYNFRNNQENNGVTDRKTPTSIDETAMKWGVKYGTGWGAAPTPPLLLNGKIYIGSGNKVLELDKETGEKLRESDAMAANVGYAMNPILYADGGLFVQVGNGIIQKIDLKTLQVAWQTPRVGGQTLCPISHVNIDGTGYIYTGTWNRENGDGRYMCFTTDDKNVEVDEQTGKKIKAATWQFVPSGSTKDTEKITYDEALNATLEEENNVAKRGFYWAGCYATENYIAVGSDDGTNEGDYTANAVFYTLNPKTGEIIDRIDGIKGDIRTTTVYDKGYLYFATKGGQVHKVSVDEDGCLGQDSYIDLGGMITAAPLVYKNKIYMGVSGMGGQFDPDGGHGFAVLDNSKETLDTDSFLYKLAIPGYPQAAALLSNAYETEDFDGDGKPDGRVYLYFTYNANPGGIYYAYDEPDMTAEDAAKTSAELFIPPQDKQQYCISTICAGKDGTLYYKNDSCYLMAVETNPAYIKDIKVTADDKNAVSWNQKFHSRFTDYNLVAKDTAKSVDLDITAADGAAVTVDGKAYTGKTTVALNGAENKTVSVVAKKGGKQRTYTLNVRTVADIATLEELSVSISNTYGSMQIPLDPEFAKDVHDYEVNVSANNTSDWYRIWPKVSDPQSGIKVIAGENIAKSNGGELITGEEMSPAGVNDKYYKGYLSDRTKDGVVKIEVTSENGKKTETYTVKLVRKWVNVTDISLNETEKTLMEGDTFQLEAKLMPENATNKAVTWSSLDDRVATVDENGLVTAVGEGKTSVSAVSVSGSKTATCEITVISLEAEIANAEGVLTGYKDKDDYRIKEQKEIAELLGEAKIALNKATSIEEIEQIVAETKAKLDAVETADVLNKEDTQVTEDTITEILENAETAVTNGVITAETAENIQKVQEENPDATITTEVVAEPKTDEEVAKNDVEAIESFVNTSKEVGRVGQYFDLSVLIQSGEDTLGEIHQLQKPINFTLDIPEEIRNADREYSMIRVHNGKAEQLDAVVDTEQWKISFDTDRFSTYALTYADSADKAAANAVAEQIQALGEITDLRQKEAVEAARAAYDNLTEAQRAYISADTLSVLTAAEAKIAELEKPAKPDPEDKPNPDDKPNPGDKPNPDDKPNPPADPDKDKPTGSKPPKADGGNGQVSGTETGNGTIPSGDKAGGKGDKASSGKEQPVTPKTGDSQDMGMWMTLMAMAGLGTVIAVRRKTEK